IPFFSSNYALLVESMKSRKSDVGWFSNLSGLEAVRKANGEVFARTFDLSGADGYKSLLIVGAASRLTLDGVLRCDKTLTLGMGDALSTSGTLAPSSSISLSYDRQQGGREADRVRVIWESILLPEDPIIWRRDLDPAVKEA